MVAQVLGDAAGVGEPGVDEGEQLLHGRPHVGIVDALLCPEHDRSRPPAGPELRKCCSSTARPSALSELGTSDVALNAEADRSRGPEHGDERHQPQADGAAWMIEAPATGAGERRGFPAVRPRGGLVVVGDVGDSGDARMQASSSRRTGGHIAPPDIPRPPDRSTPASSFRPIRWSLRWLTISSWSETSPARCGPNREHPTRRRRSGGTARLVGARSATLLEGILREDLAWRPASIAMVLVLAPALLWRRTHPLLVAAVAFGTCIAIEVASLAAGVS